MFAANTEQHALNLIEICRNSVPLSTPVPACNGDRGSSARAEASAGQVSAGECARDRAQSTLAGEQMSIEENIVKHCVSRALIPVAAAIVLGGTLAGCGSNWRTHDARVMGDSKPSSRAAPTWVQGSMPMSEDRVYFVGRSHTPDYHREAYTDGTWHGTGPNPRDPEIRVGYTVMDEREAVQSARNDVFDQIRQRLQPRNVGTTGQTATMNIDSGSCLDCGDRISWTGNTEIQAPCSSPCYVGRKHRAPNNQGSSCREVSLNHCDPCGSKALNRGKVVAVASCCGTCGDSHSFTISQSGGTTVVHSVATDHRQRTDYVNSPPYMGRDMNVLNVGIDSVMPAMLAQLSEEEIYFEKWHVHETGDSWDRPFAEGRDEWQSYKCWILTSIPRAEYNRIAEGFRNRYDELYDMSLEWTVADRSRRVDWETEERMIYLKRQEEERAWNREDEIITRDHTITLDKDRHPLPGRRFTVIGSQ